VLIDWTWIYNTLILAEDIQTYQHMVMLGMRSVSKSPCCGARSDHAFVCSSIASGQGDSLVYAGDRRHVDLMFA